MTQTGVLQGTGHVGPEAAGLIVLVIQREPGNRVFVLRAPLIHQGGLAVSSGGGNGREPTCGVRLEPFQETGAGNGAWIRGRAHEFGGQ